MALISTGHVVWRASRPWNSFLTSSGPRPVLLLAASQVSSSTAALLGGEDRRLRGLGTVISNEAEAQVCEAAPPRPLSPCARLLRSEMSLSCVVQGPGDAEGRSRPQQWRAAQVPSTHRYGFRLMQAPSNHNPNRAVHRLDAAYIAGTAHGSIVSGSVEPCHTCFGKSDVLSTLFDDVFNSTGVLRQA